MKTPLSEKLLVFYLEDPADPFNSYALALEYQKFDSVLAREWYVRVLTEFPEYLPVYYQAAQFFIEQQDDRAVEETFEKGVALARIQQNVKAEQELIRAQRAYRDEQEDW